MKQFVWMLSVLFLGVLSVSSVGRSRKLQKDLYGRSLNDNFADFDASQDEKNELSGLFQRSIRDKNDLLSFYHQLEPHMDISSSDRLHQQRGRISKFLGEIKDKVVRKIEGAIKQVRLYEELIKAIKTKIKELLENPELKNDPVARIVLGFLQEKAEEYGKKNEEKQEEIQSLKKEYQDISA